MTAKLTSPDLYFTIDGVYSHTPGWRCRNTLELAKPAHTRGTTPRIIPGAHGARPLALWRDATERALSLHVYGRCLSDGTVAATEIQGLEANLAELAAAWAAVPATADSTRTCVLHRHGTTTTGPVQILDMDWDEAEMPVAANMIIRVLLPNGHLA